MSIAGVIAKAHEVAYVRFAVPDLARMRAFLDDFGMIVADERPGLLAMRGRAGNRICHISEKGDPGLLAIGIELASTDDLKILARHEQAELVDIDLPGGGQLIRLIDPDGFTVEAVAGRQPIADAMPPSAVPWNSNGSYPRQSAVRRVARGPSHVMRLGHLVLGVSDFRRSEAWYKERFGLVTSDEIRPAPDVAAGAFMRCDRGTAPCDHHSIFLLQRPIPPGFMHAAFEVADADDLFAGHDHLKANGYSHLWGVGRHILGSQIFDYWLDPWGHEHEHWTDGDQLVTADGGGVGTMDQLMGVQWGMPMPPLPDGPPPAGEGEHG